MSLKQKSDLSTCFYRSWSCIGRLWLDPDTVETGRNVAHSVSNSLQSKFIYYHFWFLGCHEQYVLYHKLIGVPYFVLFITGQGIPWHEYTVDGEEAMGDISSADVSTGWCRSTWLTLRSLKVISLQEETLYHIVL